MSALTRSQEAKELVSELLLKEHWLQNTVTFRPYGLSTLAAFGPTATNLKLGDLSEAVSHSYELTVSAAADLQIPVVGSASGGMNRKIIVLERAAFKKEPPANATDTEKHYGYAIRLCITVSRWQANTKISLPFLAASAQLGNIEAQWILQVIGLTGTPIDEAILPPTELNVDTFVIAKQSLEKLIAAINDPKTTFQAKLIAEIRPINYEEQKLQQAIAVAYALTCLERGRSLAGALERLGSPNSAVQDSIREVYESVAGLTDAAQKPTGEIKHKAAELCGRIRADIPVFG
jgi:hypothetical protein